MTTPNGQEDDYTEHTKEAIYHFTQAIRLHPTMEAAWRHRGDMYLRLSEWKKAISDYSEAIRLTRSNREQSICYCQRGIAYVHLGQIRTGIEDFDMALRKDAQNAYAYSQRGAAYAKKHEFGLAVKDVSQAIRLDPECVYYRTLRSDINELARVVSETPN